MKNPTRISGDSHLTISMHTQTQRAQRCESLHANVARLIYELRTQAGLTQRQLAKRVGTTQPAIARLEARDYRGHSLTMLQRIADAVNGKIEIHFFAERGTSSSQFASKAAELLTE
jgi:transcriptional regulator with XRE-family HTH domain